ncbi:hypothetical protein [Plantactinospora sp. B5E13]|uniref:hypothetical protein n=1 Tax=Plantactinospora sp. B5E13 TaxID=3153758 RepID=UPI00325E7378
MPGAPRYALVAKVIQGAMWLQRTGATYGPGRWFPIGAESGCMLFLGSADLDADLVFSFNDGSLGDNGGGATVQVRQWF